MRVILACCYFAWDGSGETVAMITDGRFSGATRGPCVGQLSLEEVLGGLLAALQNGDWIEIDLPKRRIEVSLSDQELSWR